MKNDPGRDTHLPAILRYGWSAAFLVGVASIATRADAQATLGGEFQINTYTTNFQLRPWVSVGPQGEVVLRLWLHRLVRA